MQLKVRRQGAVRATTVMLAVGVNEEDQREILGLETAFGETEEGLAPVRSQAQEAWSLWR